MSELSRMLELPPVIVSKLQRVRRRRRVLFFAEGLVLTATVLLLVMMAAMAIDWLVVWFDPRWRMAVTYCALAMTASLFAWQALSPLLRRRRLSSVALDVDRAVPSLQERWTTVTELAESTDPPQVRGAGRLIRQVESEAAELGASVVEEEVVTKEAVRRRSFVLAGAIAPLLLVFLLSPGPVGVLLARFWAPTRPITMTRVASLPGDRVVARGEPLTLEARTEGRQVASAVLLTRTINRTTRIPLALPTDGDDTLTCNFRNPQDSFDYRFRAGDGQTPWHHIGVQDRPSLSKILFRITPPAYSKLPIDQRDTLPRRCRALRESKLELAIRATKPLAHMDLEFGKEQQTRSLVATAGKWYRYETTLTEPISFSIRLTDRHGLTNLAPPFCRVIVYDDQPPRIDITAPDEQITLQPDDTIEIDFKARDDFGIASAQLLVSVGEGEDERMVKTEGIPLGNQEGAKAIDGHVELDLEPFELEHGEVLNYAIRVTDTRDLTAERKTGIRADTSGVEPSGLDRGDRGRRDAEAEGPHSRPAEQQGAKADGAKDAHRQEPGQSAKSARSSKTGQQSSRSGKATQADARKDTASEEKQSPKGGQCKAGGQSPPDSGVKPKPKESCQPGEPCQKPTDDMSKRLKPGECTACSKKHRIKVDKWAGSFEGQAREKLQIAIDAYLKRLDQVLAAAQVPTDELRDQVKPETTWDLAKAGKLRAARGHLTDADQTVTQLKGISANTPYAFMGLQLHEIGHSHVTPAREQLAQASLFTEDAAAQSSRFERASFHIARARAMLADLTKKYKAVKREEKFKETMQRVAKMHRIFIEDMQALLKSCKPSLNPRDPKVVEFDISDEYKKKLDEHYEQLKKLLDDLAKALADDPDLLRRMMARTRLEGTTLRDQLTLLALRQIMVRQNVVDWLDASPGGRPLVQRKIAKRQVVEQMELAKLAAQLHENMETWIPRDLDASQGALADSRKLATEIAMAAPRVAVALSAGQPDQGLELARDQLGRLRELNTRLADTALEHSEHDKLAIFTANRIAEIAKLRSRQAGLIQKIDAVRKGYVGGAAAIDQHRLAGDTSELGGKLDRVSGFLGQLSPEIGVKARALADALNDEIAKGQRRAVKKLTEQDLGPARKAEDKLVASFAAAEKLFDELLTMVEETVAAQRRGKAPGQPCELPTLEELLKALEDECKACEKLGAALMPNLMVKGDWMLPGSGSGSGSGSGQGQGKGTGKDEGKGKDKGKGGKQGEGKAQDSGEDDEDDRTAAALAKAAEAHAKKADKALKGAKGGAGSQDVEDGMPDTSERDWNVLVSKLRDELRQGRDNVPPEQYRQAIESYLQAIAEMVSNNPEPRYNRKLWMAE